ncbi:hypothetical protein T484DRAFT_1757555 [Baffinella frigidus]|nr:hypothetical protein T484DRAFT_1757555 [Cryptophyta sp. CCMP2293]
MWQNHKRMGRTKEDVIALRWGAVLSEDPIPSMKFTYPDDSHFNKPLTVVYHHKRFDSENQRLNFLLKYDTEARDAVLQTNNEKVEKGWFVRPPAIQPTNEQLREMATLQEQVSTIWPNQFYPGYDSTYFLQMIMKVPISGPTSRIVRPQEIEDRKRSAYYNCLDVYLRHSKHSRPDHVDSRLFAYETMVDIPTPESKTIMQIYVSGGSRTNLESIPLLDYLKSSLSNNIRLVDSITRGIMRSL